MQPIDLPKIQRLYRSGTNIIDHLRHQLGTEFNTEQLVEASYDLQAGSYVQFARNNAARIEPYRQELGRLLDRHILDGDAVADVGTGEMTTLAAVAGASYSRVSKAFALDISLSRLVVGREYLREQLSAGLADNIQAVVSTLFRLPFATNSIDVVWTSHALEPNGGRELEAVGELARVSRRNLVLFEPSYEHNSDEGQRRMERLGYIKDLPGTIGKIPGLVLEDVIEIVNTENPLNPTYAYIVRKTPQTEINDPSLRCPLSHGLLDWREGYIYAKNSLLAYPIVEGIPVLRIEKGISASALDTEILR